MSSAIATDIPANAAAHCPGTESEAAGKVSACAGCPNQNVCASGAAAAPDPGIELVRTRLADVRHKVMILSGKGGVGKSTVTALLARTLAARRAEHNIGVLDIDICGPSQPRMLGALGEQVHQSGSGWSPVYVDDNLALMSIGFLLGSPDDAVIWRGPKKNGMIRQFLSEVDWGQLDYLLLDTPPGTSDEHLSATTYLSQAATPVDGNDRDKNAAKWGAVLVTTPQEVALLDVRKEISFCRKMKVPIVGVIENMARFVCPNCTTVSVIFPAQTGGAEAMCAELDVPFLGRLAIDPRLTKACDEGRNFVQEFGNSVAVQSLKGIVDNIVRYYEGESNRLPVNKADEDE